MLKTPTYHVLRMMKMHQDSGLLDVDYTSEVCGAVPKVSISATERGGEIFVSLCNTSLSDSETLELEIRDRGIIGASAEVLTAADMHEHNTFDEPERIAPKTANVDIAQNTLKVQLPAMSVMTITVK